MSSKVKSIQKGSQIIDQIFWELFKLLKSGKPLTELDLARQIKRLAKQMGAQGMAFPPIVSFGPSSAEIHHKPSSKRIGKNNFLMLDYGVKIQGYCSDFTRTLFLGQPNKLQIKVYQTVLRAYEAAIQQVRPGAECFRVDLAARNLIAQKGFGRFFNHSTGHGVGKKIHEPPNFSPGSGDLLKRDLVMTIEPGIYLPGKFGVRIEDMALIDRKPKVFSGVPRDLKSMIISKN